MLKKNLFRFISVFFIVVLTLAIVNVRAHPPDDMVLGFNSGTNILPNRNFRGASVPIITDISVHEANDMINNNTGYPDLLILDVRTVEEFNINHLYDAILIPVDELEGRLAELASYNDTEIIVYCTSGGRSLQASNILVANNFFKIFNMLGGINAWIDAGYDYWPNGDPEESISFVLPLFLVSTIGIIFVLVILNKRRLNGVKKY